MPTSKKSLADRELRWSKVYEQDQDLAAEMPELRGSLDELRATAQEVTELTVQQRYHMAQAQVLTARIRALAKRADTLRGRVGASLRGKHGFDSPELIRYGFKPRNRSSRVTPTESWRASGRLRRRRSRSGREPASPHPLRGACLAPVCLSGLSRWSLSR
jgi:hypothetical protein